ncbi:MAG: hypothetical protein HRT45_13105 [Bdellovibrionales bacterium]|nr:hypothetical protein [Bdellovibrionales bacterium]
MASHLTSEQKDIGAYLEAAHRALLASGIAIQTAAESEDDSESSPSGEANEEVNQREVCQQRHRTAQ